MSALTGRSFAIGGDFDVDIDSPLRLSATGVAIGNPPGFAAPVMASVRQARIEVEPWPLLRGRWIVRHISLDRPVVQLERNARGVANWNLPRQRGDARRLEVGALDVTRGRVRLREAALRTDLRLAVQTEQRTESNRAPSLTMRGTGRYRDRPFNLHGLLDSPLHLLRRGRPYRVDVEARAGETRLRLFGALAAPLDPRRFALQAEISGQDMADLYPLLGLAVPPTPPYGVRGQLRRERDVIHYERFAGRVGDSDVSGDLAIKLGGERPFVSGTLLSRRLDLDDLGGLIGMPPSTEPGETASPEQRVEAAQREASPRLLPDAPYSPKKLRSVDADLRLNARRIETRRMPVESLSARVRLDDGLLRIDPLDVAVAGGHLTGRVRLDARRETIASRTDLVARGLELQKLFPRATPEGVGRVAGRANLAGHGNSVARMLATADGEVGVVMGSGQVSNLLLEMAGLDIAEALRFLLGRDKQVPVRCAHTELTVEDGVATTRALAFDTTDTVILGDGTINLRTEGLDLELRPEPKDVSPVSLRGPLEVGGSFKDPALHPKTGPLVGRAAIAAALFAIAPPAALLALIETGPGEDIDCSQHT